MVSEKESRMQDWLGYFLGGTVSLMIFYHFYYILSLPWEPSRHAIVHLGLASTILILSKLRKNFRVGYAAMLAATISVNIYFFAQYDSILANPSYPPTIALVSGVISAIIVFILTVESFGWIFPTLTAISVFYTAFGSRLPASLATPPIDLQRMITLLSADVTSPWGVYGSLLILSANYLFLFIFFGAVLEAFGGLRFIISLGSLAAAKFRSGAAALSVFSSALLGTLTGSTVANITVTGSFTIPMMKKTGYTPEHAAAIETAASSGGQILPPVMGATVFVMSGYTGIPYISIAKASFIPALIYFAIVFLYAELNARKLKITAMPSREINIKNLLWDMPIFVVPLLTMLLLLIQGRSLMFTIFWSLICAAGLGLLAGIRKETRLEWERTKERLLNGVISGCQIAAVLALIGIIVGTVEVTGLGMKLGKVLLQLCQNNLLLLLIITALTAMILGVGVPTPAAYIICATILSPAMIKMGIPLLQAHLFPLYYAVFAHLTPPVAIGLMVACKMAGARYWRAAGEAMKAAMTSFVLPFFFIYAPAILLQIDSASSGLKQFLGITFLLFTLSILLQTFWLKRLSLAERLSLWAALVFLIIFLFAIQHSLLLFTGGGMILAGLLLNIRGYRREQASEVFPTQDRVKI